MIRKGYEFLLEGYYYYNAIYRVVTKLTLS